MERRNDGRAFAMLTARGVPEEGPRPPRTAELAAVLGLEAEEIVTEGVGPRGFSSGVSYLMVPVRDRGALRRAAVDLGRWREVLAAHWAPSLYLFTRDVELAGSAVRARMFGPGIGIVEDPATGAAAAGLAGYLARAERPADGTSRWVIEQGFEMGRPSLLTIEADLLGGTLTEVRVGGGAIRILDGTLRVTPAG